MIIDEEKKEDKYYKLKQMGQLLMLGASRLLQLAGILFKATGVALRAAGDKLASKVGGKEPSEG